MRGPRGPRRGDVRGSSPGEGRHRDQRHPAGKCRPPSAGECAKGHRHTGRDRRDHALRRQYPPDSCATRVGWSRLTRLGRSTLNPAIAAPTAAVPSHSATGTGVTAPRSRWRGRRRPGRASRSYVFVSPIISIVGGQVHHRAPSVHKQHPPLRARPYSSIPTVRSTHPLFSTPLLHKQVLPSPLIVGATSCATPVCARITSKAGSALPPICPTR